jgi:hypothetical protein
MLPRKSAVLISAFICGKKYFRRVIIEKGLGLASGEVFA